MPTPPAHTMILRFRDLATGPGETIEQHRRIALDKGYVWWGWWNKSQEKVPDATFRALNEVATSPAGLPIFLFDSGHEKLYSAVCREIRRDADHKRIPVPDPELGPKYYQGSSYFAWFRLENFDEIPGDIVKRYTYEKVDDFFVDPPSRFVPFYGKRVFALSELTQQNRTIWYVRPAQEGDKSHSIELLENRRLEPADFPRGLVISPSRHLLWLSDVHCGEKHGFPAASTLVERDLGQAVETGLKTIGVDNLAGAIVSGDLSWKAAPAEFAAAELLLKRVARSPSKLDAYALLTSPGNHDLAFGPPPTDPGPARHDEPVGPDQRRPYGEFYERLFFKPPNAYMSSGRRFLLGDSTPVDVVMLNSSLIQQKKDWFQGHGFVGEDQLQHAAQEMRWEGNSDPNVFRIVVIHHHLLPVIYRDPPVGAYPYSILLDAEAVMQWIVRHRVNLVLHGHMHRNFIAHLSRPESGEPAKPWHKFVVAGLGSSGVDREHAGAENSFGLLSFENDRLRIRWLSVDKIAETKPQWEHSIPLRGQPTQ